jgi:hypothetical protein
MGLSEGGRSGKHTKSLRLRLAWASARNPMAGKRAVAERSQSDSGPHSGQLMFPKAPSTVRLRSRQRFAQAPLMNSLRAVNYGLGIRIVLLTIKLPESTNSRLVK